MLTVLQKAKLYIGKMKFGGACDPSVNVTVPPFSFVPLGADADVNPGPAVGTPVGEYCTELLLPPPLLDEPHAAATSATARSPTAARKPRLTLRMFSILR